MLSLRLAAFCVSAVAGMVFANSCSIDLPFFDEITIDVRHDDDDNLEDFLEEFFDFDD